MIDPPRDQRLQHELDALVFDLRVINRPHAFLELESTNDFAIALAKQGEPGGTLVMASLQPKGRGRLGRQWLMALGDIALSLIVRSPFLPRNWALLSMIPGLAIIDALLLHNISAKLKWPNDIVFPCRLEETLPYFLHFRKLGGILVDNVFHDNKLTASLIGVGINVKAYSRRKIEVPHSIALEEIMPSFDRPRFLKNFLCCLDRYLFSLNRDDSETSLFKKYSENCETLGRNVVINHHGQQYCGRAETINSDGSLVVYDGKVTHTVIAGDVSFL